MTLCSDKLTGPNFKKCYKLNRKYLRYDGRLYIIDSPPSSKITDDDTEDVKRSYMKYVLDEMDVKSLILLTTSLDLSEKFYGKGVYEGISKIHELFGFSMVDRKLGENTDVTNESFDAWRCKEDEMVSDVIGKSGIYMIDCFHTYYNSWVLDTGCGNHICNHLQVPSE